jgi:hypothetical protein
LAPSQGADPWALHQRSACMPALSFATPLGLGKKAQQAHRRGQ